jgi:hypothetical protein
MNTSLKTLLATITIASAALSSARAVTNEYFDNATFLGSAGALTVIDFDDVASGSTFSGDRYQSDGLTIVHRDGRGQVAFNPAATAFYTAANRQTGLNVMSSGDFSGVDNFDFNFGHEVYSAGLWIGNISPGTTEIQFLGAGDVVLASEVIGNTHDGIISGGGASWDNRLFYGLTSDTAITRIRTIEPSGDGDGVTYDNVSFSAAVVSVPDSGATSGLLAMGLLTLLGLRKWKPIMP